jgi:hypothetical protein
MADKRITDLQLISALADDSNFAVDNSTQSYRTTGAQLKTYLGRSVKTVTNAGYSLLTADPYGSVLVTAGSGTRTVNLPAVADNTGRVVTIRKMDDVSGSFYVIVDASGTETIDGALTFLLIDQDDSVTLLCDGTQWMVISKSIGSRVVSRVRDSVPAGYGSTNTRIHRIETRIIGTGNAINGTTSSTNGNTYTIRQSGIYSICFNTQSTASGIIFGISRNSTELTTSILSITAAHRLAVSDSPTNYSASIAWTGRLDYNDVIRPHGDATAALVDNGHTYFEIQKIGL